MWVALLIQGLIGLLDWADTTRSLYPSLSLLMPVFWILNLAILRSWGKELSSALIFHELRQAPATMTFKFAPTLFLMMFLSFLCGASVGREGLLIQIAAALVVVAYKKLALLPEQRRALVFAAVAAAFGVVSHAPWAGLFLAVEIVEVYRPNVKFLPEVVCSVAGLLLAQFSLQLLPTQLAIPWLQAPPLAGEARTFVMNSYLDSNALLSCVALGILCGLFARLLIVFFHAIQKIVDIHEPKKIFAGFVVVCGMSTFCYLYPQAPFIGLGYTHVGEAFTTPVSWTQPVYKLLASALSLGMGFKGGEFVPSVYIGAQLGNVVSQQLGVSMPLFASLGYVAVFGALVNVPMTALALLVGLFGWQSLPFGLITVCTAFLVSGNRSAYSAQSGTERKNRLLKKLFH